jgi:hypothetical protein
MMGICCDSHTRHVSAFCRKMTFLLILRQVVQIVTTELYTVKIISETVLLVRSRYVLREIYGLLTLNAGSRKSWHCRRILHLHLYRHCMPKWSMA